MVLLGYGMFKLAVVYELIKGIGISLSVCLSPDEQYYLSAKRQIKIWKLSRNSYLSSYSKTTW
jgi:hypothetical protein